MGLLSWTLGIDISCVPKKLIVVLIWRWHPSGFFVAVDANTVLFPPLHWRFEMPALVVDAEIWERCDCVVGELAFLKKSSE
jgi:hypothetical protein